MAKELHDAMRISAAELSGAEERTEVLASQVRFAARLRPLVDAFGTVSLEYGATVTAVDVPLRELITRIAADGMEVADEAEIRRGLAVLGQLADSRGDALDRLGEMAALAETLRYQPLRPLVAALVAAILLMEEQQPVLEEWRRLVLLVPEA